MQLTREQWIEEGAERLEWADGSLAAARVDADIREGVKAFELLPHGWTVERMTTAVEGVEYGIREPDDGDGYSVCHRDGNAVTVTARLPFAGEAAVAAAVAVMLAAIDARTRKPADALASECAAQEDACYGGGATDG